MNQFKLARTLSKGAYMFVKDNDRTIYICKNLKNWAEDEMLLTPHQFMLKVSGLVSHESLHIVLDVVADTKTSSKLDNLFGAMLIDDTETMGLWSFESEFRPGGCKA